MTKPMDQLRALRDFGGERLTLGLADDVITRFLAHDPALGEAIEAAAIAHEDLRGEWREALSGDEASLIALVQSGYVNFYPPENINPYVALAARGPWLVTTHGAVLHDNGGYGMIGLGHAPEQIVDAMSAPWVMANVMTPSVSHKRFTDRLRREIGQQRGACPFDRFICMNSGSEAVTVAARISDILALRATGPGGRAEGRKPKFLSLRGSFHGRTDRPALASDSTRAWYRQHLASHHAEDRLITVPPNDVDALRAAFAQAEADGVFIEMMFLEPVMGEGNPGRAISRAFYDAARALTLAHGGLLLVDSIQAGFRGTGFLSIVDYPGFEDCEAPDLETYSKALNGGQYPLSVLACTARAADLYVRGVYGNTMTTNPRALEVGCAVLDAFTPALRENIRARGAELVEGLEGLQAEFPGVVQQVQGTGLLVSAALDPERVPVEGAAGIENWLRRHGLGVIHGGKNALRFTPHFLIDADEVGLIVDLVRQGIDAFVALAPDRVPEAYAEPIEL